MAKENSSARSRIASLLSSRVGEIVTHEEIAAVAGISEWARRLRELRDEQGWKILSHNDVATLRPGEYLLAEPPPTSTGIHFARSISAKLRAEVFDRNEFTCQMCGLTPGDIDTYTGRKVRLHVGHIVDKKLGGKDELTNLRTLCSACNQGAKNITFEKPSGIWLISQVRRAGLSEQKAVFEFLKRKFDN